MINQYDDVSNQSDDEHYCLNSSAGSAHTLSRRAGHQLADFGLVVRCLWTVKCHICFSLTTLLAAHTASFCLPYLATGHLNIGGAPPCAGKGGDWFGNTAGVL